MGYRLSKIYTRTGDAGTTGLGNGNRVSKDSLRIHALGEVDEVNAIIGLLMVEDLPASSRALLTEIQHDLFDLGGELSIPGMTLLNEQNVEQLERQLDLLNESLEPLKDFILPGGTRAAALAHQARTVCRRAERTVVGLAEIEEVRESPRRYLNRLSDLLFVLARHMNHVAGFADVQWQKDRLNGSAASDLNPP